MWWIADIIILITFSVFAGNWIGSEIYIHFRIPYSALKGLKIISIGVLGVLSTLYVAFRLHSQKGDTKMRCPYCKKNLEEGSYKRYETLMEHVSAPNATRPLKRTFVCGLCPKSVDRFWDYMGYIYVTANYFDDQKERSALGSFARSMDRAHVRRRFYRKVHIYWFVTKINIVWLYLRYFVLNRKLYGGK